uniref:DUF8040 domain-containing protein n=1 Tax=Setaria viridis TaxID=4556 RepID=A0A4U6U957_SETVI|nr:hypothetical protein SEVIR_6G159400v2 [Setaria viridis]
MVRLPLSTRIRRRNMALRNMMTSIIVIYYYMNVLLSNLIHNSDAACISQFWMDRRTFYTLCEILSDVGRLKATQNMSLEEIVVLFLYTLSPSFEEFNNKRIFLSKW